MHDVTILRVAPKDVGDNLTEGLREDAFVNVLDSVVYVFFRRTHATHHISVISHLIVNYQLSIIN